ADSAEDLSKKWLEYQAARAALSEAHDAWTAQKAATRRLTMEDLGVIRRFALTQSNPATTYNAALIPAPKTPVDGVPPGQPSGIKATLNTDTGNLKLVWKCVNPTTTSGTVYIIRRRTGTSGAWVQAGITSARSFTDTDVPTAAVVQYQITAQRSNINGVPSQPVNVAFGHGADGEAFVKSVKIAA
ncbi:MAG: fibronectin type III domain-containing protein, partial [Phycisphaerales bacterium]|nr:fibronectin type III domain-containing protein [Phycisphaerales bacterium]